MKKMFIVGSLIATAAFAQETGVATKVEGLVTANQGGQVQLLQEGTPVLEGARVITGSSGHATLKVGRNCTLTLEPNQSVTIDMDKTCPDLVASIQAVDNNQLAAAAQNGGFLSAHPNLVPIAIAAAGAGVVAAAPSGRTRPLSGQ